MPEEPIEDDNTICDWCEHRIWFAAWRAVLMLRYQHSNWYGRALDLDSELVWMHPRCAQEAMTDGQARRPDQDGV